MAFNPMIAATSGGTVGVTYYQIRRALPGKNRWLTDYWMRFSTDGGKTFKKPQRISGPFDITHVPIVQGGYFVGDYEGLAANQQSFAVLFVQTTHQSTVPSDVYATMIQR